MRKVATNVEICAFCNTAYRHLILARKNAGSKLLNFRIFKGWMFCMNAKYGNQSLSL